MLPQNSNNDDDDEMLTSSSRSNTDRPLNATLKKYTNRLWKDISPKSQLFLNISWVVSQVLRMQRFLTLRQQPASLHPHKLQIVADDRRIDNLAFMTLSLISNIFSLWSRGCRKG